jgi:hypothetical protein
MADFGNAGHIVKFTWDDGLGKITVEKVAAHKWRLLDPFTYLSNAGRRIVVPAGFETDGASSPLRTVITSWGGKYSTAALVHDYLYDCLNNHVPNTPTRASADGIFYEIMKMCGVDPYVRVMMWAAVRAFGGPGMRHIGVRT